MLKQKLYIAATSFLALLFVSTTALAQYDDMYYDPDEFISTESDRTYYNDNDNVVQRDAPNDNSFRRSDSYDNDDYYDYQYSSRIRRFNRPYAGFGYYDPVYVDVAYYDPFFRPGGSTVLIYNNFNRFNRFGSAFAQPVFTPYGVRYVDTRFGGGWNDPFYGNGFGRGGFYNNGFGINRGFGNSYYGGFGGGGVVGNVGYYCPPAWGGGNNSYVVPNSTNTINNRAVSNVPRGATTSIADRVSRQRSYGQTATPTRTASSTTARSTVPSRSRSTIDQSRTTVTRSRSAATQNRSYSPSSRSTSPQRPTRSATPNRSYTPSRSATPSRSTVPTRSRTYSPSRSTAPTRSVTPSRSYTPSRSTSPSPSRSASPSRSSSSSSSSRTSTPTRTRSGGGR